MENNLITKVYGGTEDGFTIAELKGRELFQTLVDKMGWEIIKWDLNQYGASDVFFAIGEHRVIGEIKFRDNYDITSFNGEMMLEIKKLKRLQELNSKLKSLKNWDCSIMYINFFQNKEDWAIWDITSLKLEDCKIINKMRPKTTVIDTGWEKSDVILLDTKKSLFKIL